MKLDANKGKRNQAAISTASIGSDETRRHMGGRLTMKECIERAALKRELAPYEENDFSQQMDVILAIVDAQPTADVVEVTFCKDCRYYQDAKVNEKGFLICPASGMEIIETDFCSYGQRKIETVLPKSDAKDESLEGEHD